MEMTVREQDVTTRAGTLHRPGCHYGRTTGICDGDSLPEMFHGRDHLPGVNMMRQ